MVEKDFTIEDFKEEADGPDQLFEKRMIEKDNEDFQKSYQLLFYSAVSLCIIFLLVFYAVLPISKVRNITVIGNHYLGSDYIREISGVSLKSFYYMQIPMSITEKVESDPFIESASVDMRVDNVITITVSEKEPIGYRYDGDTPVVLFKDGTVANLTSDYMGIISRLPMIYGFSEEEQTHLLTTAFKNVKQHTIEEISSVSQYTLSYDDEALMIRMRDGGIFFGSYYSLGLLNNYQEISKRMTNKSYCIYAYEGNSVASARACPWDVKPTTHDYWTDENGNYIYNKWGDRAVMHYYKDNRGGYYLDENGYWILIPIDEYGNDIVDADFLDHYLLGYYATGKLEIPVEPEEEVFDDSNAIVEETVENTDAEAEANE